MLESVDVFLNFKLNDAVVLEADKYPHLVQVFKMVNSQKEQMWQQERKSKKLSNSTLLV